MITVRFDSGYSVQYNTANYVSRSSTYTDMYTQKGGTWIAQVPNSALIESVPNCRAYFSRHDALQEENRELLRKLERARKQIARLKKAVSK
jgi:hypothetical protein